MTLKEIVNIIERIAQEQPAVHMLVRQDAYKLNACPTARYGAFAWQQGVHRTEESGIKHYTFVLAYIDRIAEDESDALDVQALAEQVLDNVIREIGEAGVMVTEWNTTPFTQRFADMCAGAFADVTFDVTAGSCGERYADYNNDYNKDFYII